MTTDILKPDIGTGIYSFSEAARILRMHPNTVSGWILGRRQDRVDAVLPESQKRGRAVTFYDLIELYIVKLLRKHGVRLSVIRKSAKQMSIDYNTAYPFATKKILTDGCQVILPDAILGYISADTKQIIFNFIEDFLKQLDFDDSMVCAYWPLGKDKHVVIRPDYAFGAPIVTDKGELTRIPTHVLYDAYIAEDRNTDTVMWSYELSETAVLEAVEFEESCRRKAA